MAWINYGVLSRSHRCKFGGTSFF